MQIELTPFIVIDESEIREDFIRSPGPGGQHVNKVSTAVQLRFDIANSASLPDIVKERLMKTGGRRVTKDGVLVITANRFRSQEQNRSDALERLRSLALAATVRVKKRVATKPSRASKQRRLATKARRSAVKKYRSPDIGDE
jgi:ribosome-associated protein